MKTFKQFIEEANQISPITGKGWMVIPPVRVKDTKGMKRHIVPDFGNPNYKPPQTPQASNKGNTHIAQIVPTSKNSQLPFKHVPIGIDMTDREKGLKRKVSALERLGILHGGTRAKDLP